MSKTLKNESGIPQEVYDMLPDLLKRVTEPFEGAERDVVLISSLVSLSCAFFTVKGLYDKDQVYANLFALIIAPPASGKGSAKYARALLNGIESENRNENKKQAELLKRSKAGEEVVVFGSTQKNLVLPANSSSSSIIKRLKANEERGNFIFDSEADTLANILNEKWGAGMSENLRKAFHHESISFDRVGEEEVTEISKPKLGLCLTGTPGQLSGLVKSAEDGLLSRFIIYDFDPELKWKDTLAVNEDDMPFDMTAYFEKLSLEVLELYNFFKDDSFEFKLEARHRAKLNGYLERLFNRGIKVYGKGSQGILKRMGLTVYRLAMVLSTISHYEAKVEGNIVKATDDIISVSIKLGNVFILRMLELYKSLVENSGSSSVNKSDEFFSKLPEVSFKRKEVMYQTWRFCNNET